MCTLTGRLSAIYKTLRDQHIVRYNLARPMSLSSFEEFYAELVCLREKDGKFALVHPKFSATLDNDGVKLECSIDHRCLVTRDRESVAYRIDEILSGWNDPGETFATKKHWQPRPVHEWVTSDEFVGIHTIGGVSRRVKETNLHMIPYHFLVSAALADIQSRELARHVRTPESYEPLKLLSKRFDAFLVAARMESAETLIGLS